MRSASVAYVALVGLIGLSLLAGCAKDSEPREGVGETAIAKGPAGPVAPVAKPQAVSTLVFPTPGVSIPFGESRFVTKWLMFGPFLFGADEFGGDPQTAAADKEFMPDEASLNGTQQPPAGSNAAWKLHDFKGAATAGLIDLETFYNAPEHVAAYAVAWINSPEEISDAKLLVGSDDYIKVWINGKLVHTYKTERRAGEADQDVVSDIALKKGPNRVVVKCVDVVLDWNFYLRFATKDQKAIGVKSE